MASFVDNLLVASKTLLKEKPRSSAFKRRAVSTAYYAAFHAVAKSCAKAMGPTLEIDSDEYERLYRSLDHGNLINAFKHPPLKDKTSFNELGNLLEKLKEGRAKADYLPPRRNIFSKKACEEHIAQAEKIIELIRSLTYEERHNLAVWLLFPKRKSP